MPQPASLARGAMAAALVTQMAVVTVLGGLFGQQLDARFATGPWLMTAGFTGGFVVGLAMLHQGFQRLFRTDDD